ncbi:GxxExxY protein [Carboxylicivirga sediminis]|uniref:GxxExxY protein n=1 Tax=Carboxylicivirga sediminis TaxID=2006564 RepID=A0A941IXT0_9BACT|nr:GxxExxY protein [Carboxylicivirga sediminis]MBR8535754.1 GxxExxY protein [Carboxylicivirga sediminis]
MPNLLDEHFPLKDETYAIIGAAMSVHKSLGFGFLEKVYQEALEIELQKRNIPFKREEQIEIFYSGQKLKQKYIADFICYEKVIVELKAVSQLSNEHEAQLYNYLKATNKKVGLLLNFGEISLKYKRINVKDYF